MEEQQTPALEAGDEAIENPENNQDAEDKGQVEGQPAEGEDGEPSDAPKEKTASQLRRERRKAELDRARKSERDAIRERDEAIARADRIKNAAQAAQPPKEADFQDFAEYQAALSAHKSMQALDDRQVKDVEAEIAAKDAAIKGLTETQQREIAQNWREQVDEAKERYADFEKVAYSAPISDSMSHIIASSDAGADIAYHLGKHPKEAARIAELSDLEAAMELGRIEARLTMPKAKTQTDAPDPITPVTPKARPSKDPAKMTPAEYRAWREKGGTF